MTKTVQPSWLSELDVRAGDHIIAIVNSDSDVDILSQYFSPALDEHHPCIAVATETIADEISHSLCSHGMEREASEVIFHHPRDLGVANGKFDPDLFLENAGERVGELVERGAERIRHAGIMRWLDEIGVAEEDRIYLEARINQVIEGSRMSGFCVYDSRHIGGHVLVQLLRTHPKVLIDDRVVANPFYAKPEEVIRELGR